MKNRSAARYVCSSRGFVSESVDLLEIGYGKFGVGFARNTAIGGLQMLTSFSAEFRVIDDNFVVERQKVVSPKRNLFQKILIKQNCTKRSS